MRVIDLLLYLIGRKGLHFSKRSTGSTCLPKENGRFRSSHLLELVAERHCGATEVQELFASHVRSESVKRLWFKAVHRENHESVLRNFLMQVYLLWQLNAINHQGSIVLDGFLHPFNMHPRAFCLWTQSWCPWESGKFGKVQMDVCNVVKWTYCWLWSWTVSLGRKIYYILACLYHW